MDDVLKNKPANSFTGKDWSDVIREGGWHADFSQEIYKIYLNVQEHANILYSAHDTSFATSLVLRFCLEDFFKERNLTIEKVVDPSHNCEYAPTFSNIEYEQKKFKSCLYSGTYFLRDPQGETYLFKIEPRHEDILFACASKANLSFNSQHMLDALVAYADTHNFLKGKKIDASCHFIYFDRKYTWDDLILSDDLKNEVRKNLSNLIEHRDIYLKNNLTVKRGLIFSGPPGTGKSLLGKILCQTSDWTFVWVTPKHLIKASDVSKIVGICRDLSPTILFLEDVDLSGASREGSTDTTILGELMNQLDGIQENKDIITIATTNKPEVIEKALIDRPGRFDKVIEFKQPTDASRIALLKYFTKDILLAKDIKLETLAKLTNGLTGAHIREFVNLAVLNAIDAGGFDANKIITLQRQHFKAAISAAKKKNFSRLGFDSEKTTSDADYDFFLSDD